MKAVSNELSFFRFASKTEYLKNTQGRVHCQSKVFAYSGKLQDRHPSSHAPSGLHHLESLNIFQLLENVPGSKRHPRWGYFQGLSQFWKWLTAKIWNEGNHINDINHHLSVITFIQLGHIWLNNQITTLYILNLHVHLTTMWTWENEDNLGCLLFVLFSFKCVFFCISKMLVKIWKLYNIESKFPSVSLPHFPLLNIYC